MIEVVPASIVHAYQMAPHMAQADADEVAAAGLTPLLSLAQSIACSSAADCALIDEVPVAIWGVTPDNALGERASLWMLGTPAVQRNAKALLRMSRYFVDWAQTQFPVLDALVDSRHDKALRWISWLGFVPARTLVMASSVPFILFERRN